jgi:hypothetical protein
MRTEQNHVEETSIAGSYTTVHRMCSDFRAQTKNIFDQSDIPPLDLAIAYENFSAGVRALGLFHGLFEAGGQHYDINNAWKFDFFRTTNLREMAIAATARADMVILSVGTRAELPPEVKWWMEASLEQRDGDPGALILLLNDEKAHGSAKYPAEIYLAQCALRTGLDFFVKRSSPKNQPDPRRQDFWLYDYERRVSGLKTSSKCILQGSRRMKALS